MFVCFSNTDVPEPIIQLLKKQCNPAMTKSFKERNPDLDMDEIQRNPNIPDDIKAVLNGSVLDEDDGVETEPIDMVEVNDTAAGELFLDKYDDFYMEESDEEKKYNSRRRKKKIDDEDWHEPSRERREKARKDTPPKPRGRRSAKRKSAEGETSNTEKVPEKVKRKYVRKNKTTENVAATVENKTKAVKKPPEMPFNLSDPIKKFEGKIPFHNVTATATSSIQSDTSSSTTSCTTTTTTIVNTPTTTVYSQTTTNGTTDTTNNTEIPTRLDVAQKQERNTANKTQARRKITPIKVPPPVVYAKSAITYPNPKSLLKPNESGIKIDLSATLSSILSPDELSSNGNKMQTTNGNGILTSGTTTTITTSKTSKYVSI